MTDLEWIKAHIHDFQPGQEVEVWAWQGEPVRQVGVYCGISVPGKEGDLAHGFYLPDGAWYTHLGVTCSLTRADCIELEIANLQDIVANTRRSVATYERTTFHESLEREKKWLAHYEDALARVIALKEEA
jgi:hypothetical protein